jgi:hypothetical protein
VTDRGLRRTELLDGLKVQLGQPPLGGIMLSGPGNPVLMGHRRRVDFLLMDQGAFAVIQVGFGGALAPPRQIQCDDTAAADRNAEPHLQRVQPRGR